MSLQTWVPRFVLGNLTALAVALTILYAIGEVRNGSVNHWVASIWTEWGKLHGEHVPLNTSLILSGGMGNKKSSVTMSSTSGVGGAGMPVRSTRLAAAAGSSGDLDIVKIRSYAASLDPELMQHAAPGMNMRP